MPATVRKKNLPYDTKPNIPELKYDVWLEFFPKYNDKKIKFN